MTRLNIVMYTVTARAQAKTLCARFYLPNYPKETTTMNQDELERELNKLENLVNEGNIDLTALTVEELQQEELRLKQLLARREAEAKVAALRRRTIKALRTTTRGNQQF